MAVPTTDFHPGALARAADPYAALAEQRGKGRVLRGPTSWLVLGHAEAHALLRSSATRSDFIAEVYRSLLPPGAAREEMTHRINFLDPPDHTRVRRLVAKAFTPRRVEGLRPYVARMLSEPMAFGAVTIPAGEPVVVLLAAANRDPAAYADPERFDPARWLRDPPPPAPLSFAFGAHFCLGASLARLEAQGMLETLLALRPEVALSGEPLRWRHSGLFRGLQALPVRLGPAASRDAPVSPLRR